MKKVFVCEVLCTKPLDEGYKKTAFLIASELARDEDCLIISQKGSGYDGLETKQIALNKLLLNISLFKEIKKHKLEAIYYLPESSVTLPSLARAKILQYVSHVPKVVLIAVQSRKYPGYLIPLVKLVKPKLVLVFSPQDEEYLKNLGFEVRQLHLGVDTSKFRPAASGTAKYLLRDKYNIPRDKFVLVHVGHLKPNRNIESLLELLTINNIQLIIVGSTSTQQEAGIKNRLVSAGVAVFDQYIERIEEIYQLADAYIFPVKEKTAAISFPLSVLEAMACNLPVITTRFGGLVGHFAEAPDFRYYDKDEALAGIIKDIGAVKANNREKVMQFSWSGVVRELNLIGQSLG